jgi:hypothetical protein
MHYHLGRRQCPSRRSRRRLAVPSPWQGLAREARGGSRSRPPFLARFRPGLRRYRALRELRRSSRAPHRRGQLRGIFWGLSSCLTSKPGVSLDARSHRCLSVPFGDHQLCVLRQWPAITLKDSWQPSVMHPVAVAGAPSTASGLPSRT